MFFVTIVTHCHVIGTNGKAVSIDVDKSIDTAFGFYCPIDRKGKYYNKEIEI